MRASNPHAALSDSLLINNWISGAELMIGDWNYALSRRKNNRGWTWVCSVCICGFRKYVINVKPLNAYFQRKHLCRERVCCVSALNLVDMMRA